MTPELICSRFEQLESERKTLDNTLQIVERFVTPFRGEFYRDLSTEHEVDWRRRGLYDSTAVTACQSLASSIHSNLTSPSVQWFSLNFQDDSLNTSGEARKWLDEVEKLIWRTLLESDFNGEIAKVYLDICSFGTSILLQEEVNGDMWKGMDFTATPMMDSYFELGGRDKVNRVYFRKRMTLLQIKDRFPDADLSELGDPEEGKEPVSRKYEVILCIYKRKVDPDVDLTKPVAAAKRPVGFKWVLKQAKTELENGGYYYMPATVVRWQLTSGSKYGHSPAMISLADILQLNEFTAQISEATAKSIDPAMWTTARGIIGDLELRPGALVDVQQPDQFGIMPEGSNFSAGEVDRVRLQNSIMSTFGVDRLDLKESPAMTATEVHARLERMLRMFAPVLGGLEPSLLDPLIENTYASLGRHGQLPDMPEVLEGANLNIEYTGPMPRAMKSDIANGTEMWLALIHQMAQMAPETLDLIDNDLLIRGQAEMRGVPAKYLRSEKEVMAIREQRQQQQQEAMEIQRQQAQGEANQATGEGAVAMEEAQGAIQ